MNSILQDLHYTLRQLRRSPGFAVTAIVTLALGIGATTAMYSLVRSTLLAPLPYPHSEELIGIGLVQSGTPPASDQTGETGDFLLAHAQSFSSIGIAGDRPLGQNFSNGSGKAQTIYSLHVSSGYLPTLGVPALLGRTFTREEDLPGAAPTVVLSEDLWRRVLNADPNIVGQAIHINGDPFTVIGVMPSTLSTVDGTDVWQPLHLSATDPGYQGTNFQTIARLKPGASVAQASAELSGLTSTIFRQFPDYQKWTRPGAPKLQEFVWPLQQIVVSNARSSLIALSAAVLAVLLMACLNLAGLMTARSITRKPEIALRTALGASRTMMLRLLLTESLVLALVGSLLGLGFAYLTLPLLLSASPIGLPQLCQTTVDLPVMAFAILIGCASTLLFGLIPALGVFRQTIGSSLGNARTAGESAPRQRLSKSLIVAQVTLAMMLLSAGTLLLSVFLHMSAIPSGVRPEHLDVLQVNLKGDAYSSALHTQQFIAAVEQHLRQIPGVSKVSTVNGLPLDHGLNSGGGPANHPDQRANVETRFVTPGYFGTEGITLLAGTDISDADTATSQPVALISEFAARRWFPNRSPIGEYVDSEGNKPRRVIGLVANVHNYSLADQIRPTIYVPYAQVGDETMKSVNGWFATTFVLRTAQSGDSRDPDIAAAAAAAITKVDPEVPVSAFVPMQSFIDSSVAAPRFFSWLAGGFAGFALLLTLIGLFGLLSYQVTSRTRELGVRMALGAQRHQILSLVLKNGIMLTAIGLVFGSIGSCALRSVIAALVSSTVGTRATATASLLGAQTVSISIAGAAMLVSAIAASLIPARRAATLEPTEALRAE
jgi:predicted permease